MEIEETPHENYLHDIFDNKLSFNQHIDEMSKKATNQLYLCYCNRHMLSKEIKHCMYYDGSS